MDPKLDISTAGVPPKRSVGAISLFLGKSGSIYCDAAEPDHDVKEQNQQRGFWHADSSRPLAVEPKVLTIVKHSPGR